MRVKKSGHPCSILFRTVYLRKLWSQNIFYHILVILKILEMPRHLTPQGERRGLAKVSRDNFFQNFESYFWISASFFQENTPVFGKIVKQKCHATRWVTQVSPNDTRGRGESKIGQIVSPFIWITCLPTDNHRKIHYQRFLCF